MSARRFTAVALLLVVAAPALVGALATPAAAQGGVQQPRVTVLVTDPGEDLVPTRPTSLEIIVRYAYPPGSASPDPVVVNLEIVKAPPWTKPELDPATLTFPVNASNAALGGSVERRAVANLTLDASAPAREREGFVVKATAQPSGNLAGAEGVSPEIGMQAAFIGKLNLTAPESVRVSGGRAAEVTFKVANEGNGETPVAFEILARPKNSIVTPPEGITLARNATTEVTVTLRTPWTANEQGILKLQALPERAGRDAKPVEWTVQVQGLAVVPGAASAWVPVALLGVALLARRARR